MAYQFPKPPGMSKEDSDKWDKRQEKNFRIMTIGTGITTVLFGILLGIILWAKYFKH
jgi:hypothetical protein